MSFVATAIGGSAVIGAGSAYMQGEAAQDAAASQARLSKRQFAQQQALQQPYMYAGNAALNPLFALYGINSGLPTGANGEMAGAGNQQAAMDMFYQSPEYMIQKQSLDQALQRQASASGTRYSPSTALGQAEIAGRTFGDWRNNLASLANLGPQGAGIQSQNLQTMYSGLMNSAGAMGQAKGNTYGAIGQTLSDTVGQLGQYGAYRNQMTALNQQGNQGFNYLDATGGMPSGGNLRYLS